MLKVPARQTTFSTPVFSQVNEPIALNNSALFIALYSSSDNAESRFHCIVTRLNVNIYKQLVKLLKSMPISNVCSMEFLSKT